MQFYYYDVRVDAKASVSLYLDFFSLSNNAKAERLLLRFKKMHTDITLRRKNDLNK